jgi:hypothetical protein
MRLTLNPLPAIRAFVRSLTEGVRDDLFALEGGLRARLQTLRETVADAEAGIRTEVERAETRVKTCVEGAVGEAEARILAAMREEFQALAGRIGGSGSAAQPSAAALPLPASNGPGVPRGRNDGGDAAVASPDPLGNRPHP